MRIGAYQFAGSGDLGSNYEKIYGGIEQAARHGVRLLAFQECALTGYPPLDVKAEEIDFGRVQECAEAVGELAEKYGMYLLLGSATGGNGEPTRNSILVFSPEGEALAPYHKRALWGWDRDNFSIGSETGIYEMDGLRVGVRICFEVRFPEFFRELYRAEADLGVVCFRDRSERERLERYQLIKGHLQTRAVENVLPILSVNDGGRYQTAPTAFFDQYGMVRKECERHQEALLVWDFEKSEEEPGKNGIRYINTKWMGNADKDRSLRQLRERGQ